MRRRFLAPLMTLLPVASLALSCASDPEQAVTPTPGPQPAAAAQAGGFEVVPLKYANAVELADVLRKAGLPDDMRAAADTRTNSLVVTGPAGELPAVLALIAKLDTPVSK